MADNVCVGESVVVADDKDDVVSVGVCVPVGENVIRCVFVRETVVVDVTVIDPVSVCVRRSNVGVAETEYVGAGETVNVNVCVLCGVEDSDGVLDAVNVGVRVADTVAVVEVVDDSVNVDVYVVVAVDVMENEGVFEVLNVEVMVVLAVGVRVRR